MASDDRIPSLLFLWSLAPLMAGCPDDDNGGDDSPAMTVSPNTTGNGTDATAGDDGSATSTGDGGPSTMTGSMTTTPMTGATADDTTGGDDDEGTTGEFDCTDPPPVTGEISELCVANVQKYADCYGYRLTRECAMLYAAYCQESLDYAAMTSPACGTAYEELLACFNALSCEELMGDSPCEAEFTALDMACK